VVPSVDTEFVVATAKVLDECVPVGAGNSVVWVDRGKHASMLDCLRVHSALASAGFHLSQDVLQSPDSPGPDLGDRLREAVVGAAQLINALTCDSDHFRNLGDAD